MSPIMDWNLSQRRQHVFFDMSAQEGGKRFELVTLASLGVVPTD
jgi:hypothetical protein